MARRLLVRLADTDDGGALVRRPAPLAELDLDGDGGDGAGGDRVLRRRGGCSPSTASVLDVAHEALLTAWPRLARWLDDDAAGRVVRRHLAPAAQEWQRRGEPEDELYRGRPPRRRPGLGRRRADDELTAVERRFLDASKARADAELLAAREQTRRRGARPSAARWLAAGLAAVLVVALVAAVLAVRSRASGRPRHDGGRGDVARRRREPAGRAVVDGRTRWT